MRQISTISSADLFGAFLGFRRQIVVGVMRLADTTEEYGHDAGHGGSLGSQKGAVREAEEQ